MLCCQNSPVGFCRMSFVERQFLRPFSALWGSLGRYSHIRTALWDENPTAMPMHRLGLGFLQAVFHHF